MYDRQKQVVASFFGQFIDWGRPKSMTSKEIYVCAQREN